VFLDPKQMEKVIDKSEVIAGPQARHASEDADPSPEEVRAMKATHKRDELKESRRRMGVR
jgi:hypothetical protein